jgi:hypothetical protein
MATAGAMVEVTAIDPLFPSGAMSNIAHYRHPSLWTSISGINATVEARNFRRRCTDSTDHDIASVFIGFRLGRFGRSAICRRPLSGASRPFIRSISKDQLRST